MTRIPSQSAKRRGERPERERIVTEARERDGGCVLAGVVFPCRGPLDGHEVVRRGALPGAHLIPELVVTLCRSHHNHVTEYGRDGERWGVCYPSWVWDRYPERLTAWIRVATTYARQNRGARTLAPWWRSDND